MSIAMRVYGSCRCAYSGGACAVADELKVLAQDVKEVVDKSGLKTFDFSDILYIFTENCCEHARSWLFPYCVLHLLLCLH